MVGKTSDLKALTAALQKHFTGTVKGQLLFIPGIGVKYYNDAISLGQHLYISQVLERFRIHQCRSFTTPIDLKYNY